MGTQHSTEITYGDVDFYVEYDYTPPERAIMYDRDGGGCPAEPADVCITLITHKDTDFSSLFTDKQWKEIEEKVLGSHCDD
jgi:hypothetical protein